MAAKREKSSDSLSRRRFVAGGAVAAALAAPAAASTVSERDSSIKIPSEVPASRSEPPRPAEFPMTGAQVFAKACKEEGLAALFCAPGNYTGAYK